MKQYNYDNKVYTVINCTLEDIPSHTERVLLYWKSTNTDIDEQIKLLQDAVKANTAFKVIDDTGTTKACIYYNLLHWQTGQSNYLWFENKRMLAILSYYLRMYCNLVKLLFKPHSKTYIPFSFIVEDSSIRLFHSHDYPLEVNLWSKKCISVYENHFVKYNIKEI